MRVKQVAERYDVTEHTVLAWITSGELKGVDVSRNRGGKPRWRITPEAIEAFEHSRTSIPPVTKTRRRGKRRKAEAEEIEFY